MTAKLQIGQFTWFDIQFKSCFSAFALKCSKMMASYSNKLFCLRFSGVDDSQSTGR